MLEDGNLPVDKPFPRPDYFIHRRPLAGIRRPAFLDQLPHLGGKTKSVGSRRFDRPFPVEDPNDDGTVRHIRERILAREDLHNKHRERKNISRFRRRFLFGAGFTANDFRSEPLRGSCNSTCCHSCEGRVRGDGSQAVITDLGSACLGYYHVGLNRFCHQFGVDQWETRHAPPSGPHG